MDKSLVSSPLLKQVCPDGSINLPLILAGSQISLKGPFEFLSEYFSQIFNYGIITSSNSRHSYYMFYKSNNVEKSIENQQYKFLSFSMQIAEFTNQTYLLGTYIGLERFINKDHRFIRKIISILDELENEDMILLKELFMRSVNILVIIEYRLNV